MKTNASVITHLAVGRLALAIAVLLLVHVCSPPLAAKTRISLVQDRWQIDGQAPCRGSKASGLLVNVRMANAVFEDRKRPQFNPEANTDAFIAHIPDYRANGVRAFSVCLQGGDPGYKGALNSAFNADGSLRPSYMARAARLIEACDSQGLVVILACFYQEQDQILRDDNAVRVGVVSVVKWLEARGFSNVLLEIANEFGHPGFNRPILKKPAGAVELIALAKRTAPGLLVSTSGMAAHADVIRASDFILVHFNGDSGTEMRQEIAQLKKFGKPIVCNEDDKVGQEAAQRAELCVANGASWGFMCYKKNQTYPFSFRGAADDQTVYATLKRLTTPSTKKPQVVAFESFGDGADSQAAVALKFLATPDGFLVSWPANEAGCVLQSSPSLTPGVTWIDSTNVPAVVGTEFVVSNGVSAGSQFYRLVRRQASAAIPLVKVSIPEFGWVIPGKLCRCAQPKTVREFKQLRSVGVTSIIKLNKYGLAGDVRDANELAMCHEAGISEFITAFEMQPDTTSVRVQTLERWLKNCVSTIEQQRLQGKVVCVHCTHGKDRTGAAVEAYNVLLRGWSWQHRARPDWLKYGDGIPVGSIEYQQDRNLFSAVKSIADGLGQP